MSDDPYLPDDLPAAQPSVGQDDVPPGRPGCLSPNVVGAFFLLLTVLFLVYFGVLMVNPYVPINPFPPRTPLPVYVVATADPFAPTATLTPTKPPDTPQLNTLAPTASPTQTPQPALTTTQEATAVVVTPPRLPTATSIPPTATLVGGPAQGEAVEGVFTPPPPGDPALYTRAPFPFTIYQDAVTYIANPNDQGCRWASIAGSVTDLAGEPVAGLAVHVVGGGIDEIRFTGTAPTYGAGGFEIFLNGAPLRGEYAVQLLSQTGAPISEEFTVETSPVCEENVAIVNFVQNHAY